MKLSKLLIKAEYGSLKEDFELIFRHPYNLEANSDITWDQFHPFCFAGLNGSGKSNVLEALSNIFYHLESCANVKQPEIFVKNFSSKNCKPDAFELEYYIHPERSLEFSIENMVKINVTKEKKVAPTMSYTPFPFNGEAKPITVVADKNTKLTAPAKIYLPDLVIGYSSGENEILSIPFLKTRLLHFDEYVEILSAKGKYKEPESKLLYIDYEMSQAVLLVNLIFQNASVLEPLDTELKIKDVKRFRMNLNHHLVNNLNIFENYADIIQAFKNCSTSYYEDEVVITLDFWINKATKEAFKSNFPDGIFQLFQAFQILYTLNYRTVTPEIKADVYQSKGFYTDGKVPTPSPEHKVFYFLDFYISKEEAESERIIQLLMKNLSDGEQQFLHTLGICLMLTNKRALLLLDEPETHFNPDWRSKFMSTLKKSLEASESNNLLSDILITSHSPFIVSDCRRESVIIFDKGKVSNPKINTFGTSVNILTEEVFKKTESIAGLPMEIIDKIKKSNLSTIEGIQSGKEAARILGESVEKVLLFRELLIREKKLRSND